jgi:SAM-dependent methyltransferase
MRSLRQRSYEPELMDEGGISFAEFHECLRSLEIINILTLAYRPTLRRLREVMTLRDEPLHILDAGSGGGDMLRRVQRLARRKKRRVVLTGVDLNPWSKRSAETSFGTIRYETADIFSYEPDEPVDIVISSLFTHHLDDDQLILFLRWMDSRARREWFINDLHRHVIPYYFVKFATRAFSRNRLIRHDAAVSVSRAFTAADWRRLLEKAGIGDRARVHWFFPFRLCVSCRKA